MAQATQAEVVPHTIAPQGSRSIERQFVAARTGDMSLPLLLGHSGVSTVALAVCGVGFIGLVIRRRRQLSGSQLASGRTVSRTPA